MNTIMWKSGAKGKAICIGGVAAVLLLLLQCGCGGSNGKGGWQYTGKKFQDVFYGYPEDEGEVYMHNDYYYIKIMQATKKGNLVESHGDRVIWVETPGKRYEDGQLLGDGYYVRRGSYEYETAIGAEKTVARYVQVTDKKMLQEFEKVDQQLEAKEKAEEEAREAQEKAEEEAGKKAAKEAAEQGAYELDIPVKSLCGFKLGAPPSQVQNLLLNDDGTPVEDLYETGMAEYQLAKPFRLFTRAEVGFMDQGAGKHLQSVTLYAPLDENVSRESYYEEAKTLSEVIEKKFGIKFRGTNRYYAWDGENESIKISFKGFYLWKGMECDALYLKIEVSRDEIDRLDTDAIKARKASIQIDNDVGFDDL